MEGVYGRTHRINRKPHGMVLLRMGWVLTSGLLETSERKGIVKVLHSCTVDNEEGRELTEGCWECVTTTTAGTILNEWNSLAPDVHQHCFHHADE
uniref:Uncharacterized protein n=1 Tax=Physcomitrium patens TaxID=3218 RepID=A0A2K1K2R4_PHYPA|nr:hypothetical protein PHYPA_012544 [Physcomitrium patens]